MVDERVPGPLVSPEGRMPERIGRFRIVAELGRGAMGVVYEAQDPDLERVVAVKAIRIAEGVPEAQREEFEARFLAEAKAAARLSHPGIVVVHEVGRDPETGALFMALERLRGRTLAAVLAEQGRLAWRDALSLAARVADALQHAHAHGVVHRDVKPANVMLLDSGDVKVMDFGIAKLQASHAQLTSTGQFFGTPLYMSPEQALGHSVDGRSDLFSLGGVLYQLLTGRRLFDADSVPRILTRIAYEPAHLPSETTPGLPPGVDAIVMRCLAKHPEERYPDGRTLAEDLRRVLDGGEPKLVTPLTAVGEMTRVSGTTLAAPPPPQTALPPPSRAPRPRPPRFPRAWAALAGLVVLGAAAAWLLRPDPFAETGPPPGPPARAERSATPEPAPFVEPARLLVDFQHHYEDGRIRVWVDREPVVDAQIGGHVKAEVAGIRIRQGSFDAEVEVPPGRHDVTVQVDWDDNRRFESISGRFSDGEARRLKVRIDRILKRMSLSWD